MRRSHQTVSRIAAALVLRAVLSLSSAVPALAGETTGRGAAPVHAAAQGKTSFAVLKLAYAGPTPGKRWAPAPKHPKPVQVNPAMECLRLLTLHPTPTKPVLRQAPLQALSSPVVRRHPLPTGLHRPISPRRLPPPIIRRLQTESNPIKPVTTKLNPAADCVRLLINAFFGPRPVQKYHWR